MRNVHSEKTIEIVGAVAVNVHLYAPYYMRGVWWHYDGMEDRQDIVLSSQAVEGTLPTSVLRLPSTELKLSPVAWDSGRSMRISERESPSKTSPSHLYVIDDDDSCPL